MKNSVFVVAALLFLAFGCQSTHQPQWLTPSKAQWLTPSKESSGRFLGQVPTSAPPVGDPFIGDPFASDQVTSHQVTSNQVAGNQVAGDPFALTASAAPPVFPPAFDPFAPIQQGALGSDQAAREAERERIRALATAQREGAPDYMQPLSPWAGPFSNRTRGRTLEQDVIQQVAYQQVNARHLSSGEYEFDWEKEVPKSGFDWSFLDPANFFTRIRDQMGLGPDEEKANASMLKGREILLANPDLKNQAQNLEAAKHFMEAAKRFPNSVLEEDALHLAAECYFFADDYPNAMAAYQQLVIKYQHSRHVDNAVRRLFLIGRYWEIEAERGTSPFNFTNNRSLPRFDTFGHAKKAYETIFTYDPLGPVADAALMALADAYLRRGRHQGDDNFNLAAFYYQRVREEHPTSKYIAGAYERELYARTRAYLGAENPGGTLQEARRLAESSLWLRNDLNSENQAGILEIKEGILVKEAERLWVQGQFWDMRKRHYGAARISYNQLIAEYPQTEFAERARRRLEVIEGLPDVPPIFGFPINPFKAMEW